MLIKDFYKIDQLSSIETDLNASIVLNPEHEVYKGHFPSQPVVPGVIQLQIVKELLEKQLNQKLFMGSIAQVKYLIPITPLEFTELNISVAIKSDESNTFKTNVSIHFGDTVFTKAKITFTYL